MSEIYAEAGVKKQKTVGVTLIRFLLIFLIGIAVALSFVSTFVLIFAVILIAIAAYFFPKLNVEYEYIYCDGQLDFDKIMGNSRRKTMLRVEFEQVDIMAPEDSHSLDNFNHAIKTVKDFSSGSKEAKRYALITKKEEGKVKILFEPNANMIQCIKMKNPRKVLEY
ncbi:MAG: hypothetical protein K0S18_467 [Anaerocolumna sp.]|jgi:hypothetical protein|nr:hypothetical protein [Anaerocolumna sp.]